MVGGRRCPRHRPRPASRVAQLLGRGRSGPDQVGNRRSSRPRPPPRPPCVEDGQPVPWAGLGCCSRAPRRPSEITVLPPPSNRARILAFVPMDPTLRPPLRSIHRPWAVARHRLGAPGGQRDIAKTPTHAVDSSIMVPEEAFRVLPSAVHVRERDRNQQPIDVAAKRSAPRRDRPPSLCLFLSRALSLSRSLTLRRPFDPCSPALQPTDGPAGPRPSGRTTLRAPTNRFVLCICPTAWLLAGRVGGIGLAPTGQQSKLPFQMDFGSCVAVDPLTSPVTFSHAHQLPIFRRYGFSV